MQVVYLDGVFALNSLMDALLLSAASRLTGRSLPPLRLLLAAVLGGLYACVTFLPQFHGLGQGGGAVAFLVLLSAAAFGERFWQGGAALLGLSCGLCGVLLLLERLPLGLRYRGGLPATWLDAQLLLLAGSGLWAAVSLLPLGNVGRSARMPVLVECNGKTRLLTALVDTGNTLTDPLTGRAVLIVEYDAIRSCLPTEITREACTYPAAHLSDLTQRWPEGHLRLLPCKTVGAGQTVLLALRADRVCAGGRDWGETLLAITPVSLSNGSYRCLIGAAG